MSKLKFEQIVEIQRWWDRELFSNSSCVGPEGVSKALRHLHDSRALSWPVIGSLPFLKEVPQSTLYDIADTGKVPKKWQRYLRVKPDYPPRISISKVNVDSAFKTITNNLDRAFVYELWDELGDWLDVWRED